MTESTMSGAYVISLGHTVESHGWVALKPWHWDPSDQILSRHESPYGAPGFTISIKQTDPKELSISISPISYGVKEQLYARNAVTRWLSLDWNPTEAINLASSLDQQIADHLILGGGRFLRGTTFYEDLIKTICTINTNWASTRRMVEALVLRLGHGAFPDPQQILGIGEPSLNNSLKLGFRSKVILAATNDLLEQGFIDSLGNLLNPSIQSTDLLAIKGIGPYTANHVMMLCHNYATIPVDSEVAEYCRSVLKIPTPDIDYYFSQWKQFRFLGYKLGRLLRPTTENPQ